MKTSTLIRIAKEIEAEHQITLPGTSSEVIARLKKSADGVRSARAVRMVFEAEIYGLSNQGVA